MSGLFQELKRRNVVRVGIGYTVLAWVLMQIVDTMFPALKLPEWTITFIAAILLIGFPVALFMAWAYELTPEGLKKTEDVKPGESITDISGRKIDFIIIVLLGVAVGYFAVDKFWPTEQLPEEPVAVVVPQEEIVVAQSIAVLPFVNMSPDPDQEFFADGMTEEILNTLVKIPGLQVAARTSVFRFKGERVDIRDVGKALGVSNILEGSIRRAGDDLRITAQLVRTSDGFHLWSETYDRKMENVFEIQEDIATRIAAALQTPLGVVLIAEDDARRDVPLDAYDKFLRARALHKRRGDYVDDSIRLFREVVEVAPEFADAWAGLSLALEVAPYYVAESATPEGAARAYAESGEAARKALEIDPDSANAHHAMANTYRNRFQWTEAEAHFEQALALDPDDVNIIEDYTEFTIMTGQRKKGWPFVQRMVELDPFVPVFQNRLTDYYLAAGDMDAALAHAQKVTELDPETGLWADVLIDVYLLRGEYDQALAVYNERKSRWPAGRLEEYIAWMQGPDLPLDPELLAVVNLAGGYVQAGTRLKHFIDTFDDRPDWNGYMFAIIVSLDQPERANDPEMKAYIEHMGLPAYWREHQWPDMCRAKGDDDFECGHF